MDSARAANCSAYGYERPTTPALESLAAQGTLYEQAISVGSWTLPVHATMFTGLYQSSHGLRISGHALPEDYPTLARRLGELGYATACFSNNPYISLPTGLAQGFAKIEDLWRETRPRGTAKPKGARIEERLAAGGAVRACPANAHPGRVPGTPTCQALARVDRHERLGSGPGQRADQGLDRVRTRSGSPVLLLRQLHGDTRALHTAVSVQPQVPGAGGVPLARCEPGNENRHPVVSPVPARIPISASCAASMTVPSHISISGSGSWSSRSTRSGLRTRPWWS